MFLKVKINSVHIMLNMKRIDWYREIFSGDSKYNSNGTVEVFTGGDYFHLDKDSSEKFLKVINSGCLVGLGTIGESFFMSPVDDDLGEEED